MSTASALPHTVTRFVANESWPAELVNLPDLEPEMVGEAFPKLFSHPKIGAQRWLAAQTRHGEKVETVIEAGHDAGVVQVRSLGTSGWVAIANNRNGRHCQTSPYHGALIAVVETLRNLACAGATPVSLTHHLQMALPETDAQRDALKEVARGLAEASHFFGIPVLAGNLDLDLAAPASLCVTAMGSLDRISDATGPGFKRAGDRIILLGEAPSELVGSHFLCLNHGICTVHVPDVDLKAEKRLQNVLRTLIRAGVVLSAHDLAPGGLLVTVAEKLFSANSGLGAKLDLHCFGAGRNDALLFGESQGRVVISVRPERVGTVLSESHTNGVAATVIGEVTDTEDFAVCTRKMMAQWSLAELRQCGTSIW